MASFTSANYRMQRHRGGGWGFLGAILRRVPAALARGSRTARTSRLYPSLASMKSDNTLQRLTKLASSSSRRAKSAGRSIKSSAGTAGRSIKSSAGRAKRIVGKRVGDSKAAFTRRWNRFRASSNPYTRLSQPASKPKSAWTAKWLKSKPKTKWGKRTKKFGKALAKTTLKTALGTGISIGAMVLYHKLASGEPITQADVAAASKDAGLNMMDQAMKGNANGRMVQKELTGAFSRRLQKKRAESRAQPTDWTNRLKNLATYLEFRRQERKRLMDYARPSGYKKRTLGQPFGSGLGKRKVKRKKKKGKKRKAGSRGMQAMNTLAARRRAARARDVFDLM